MTQRRMARLGLGQWVELNGASLISLSPVSLRALSISLSLVSKSGNGLKVKYKSKMISGSKLNILRSTENIFWKIYISCATKHPHLRKSISESDLKPKQTQPYFYKTSTLVCLFYTLFYLNNIFLNFFYYFTLTHVPQTLTHTKI